MVHLNDAINSYSDAVDDLLKQKPARQQPGWHWIKFPRGVRRAYHKQEDVIQLFTLRDNLDKIMKVEKSINPQDLIRIADQDRKLRDQARKIVMLAGGRSTLEDWRRVIQPPESMWWWFLDEIEAAKEQETNLLLPILAGLFLTISLSVTTEIAQRFFSGGPDSLGVFYTLVQALLAILAGSTFLAAGRKWIENLLSRRGIASRYYALAKTGLAFAVLIIVVVSRLALLPVIALNYNNMAYQEQHQDGNTSVSAVTDYQRAVHLNPDYADAHYNLGTMYENTLDYEKAQSEYIAAILAGTSQIYAYNNLGRIFLLKDEFRRALEALYLGLKYRDPKDTLLHYVLLKNQGWANMGLKYQKAAEEDLDTAIRLYPKEPAAHCLRAQLYDAWDPPKPAQAEWEACVSYTNAEVPPEPGWLAMAQDRLYSGKSK